MATLAVQKTSPLGAAITDAAASAGGDVFQNTGCEVLLLRSSSGSSKTITIATPGAVGELAIDDLVVSLGATSTSLVGPFKPEVFNNSSGQVSMTYSSETSLNVTVLRGH